MKTFLFSIVIALTAGFVAGVSVQGSDVGNFESDRDIPYSGHSGIDPVVDDGEGSIQGVDYVESMTSGDSMEPTMQKGHKAFFQEYSGQELEKGDVVAFEPLPSYRDGENDSEDWMHRVVTVRDDYVLTQGDNNEGMEKVPKENIRSIAVAIVFTQ